MAIGTWPIMLSHRGDITCSVNFLFDVRLTLTDSSRPSRDQLMCQLVLFTVAYETIIVLFICARIQLSITRENAFEISAYSLCY